jgi:hypothetical protein
MKKNYNGIWFYGLSGSGKSFACIYLKKKIGKNSLIIDGDKVRKYISYDLGYSSMDRKIQITRVSGLAKIVTEQSFFPLISTVFMNNKILKTCKILKILPVKVINKDIKKIMKNHPTYKNKMHVVGKDISLSKLNTKKIENDLSKNFYKKLDILIK